MKKIITTPLGIFGLFYLTSGIVLSIWMLAVQSWPTSLFFISMFIGLIFVLLSRINWNFRFSNYVQGVIGILPILALYTLLRINSPSDDIFLLPYGYRGKVIVIYGQQNGAPEEYEGDKRLYRIPDNGLLRTRFNMKGNSIRTGKYYFVDKNGKRTKIEINKYLDTTNTISVLIRHGKLGRATDANNNEFLYLDFIVDKVNVHYSDDILKDIQLKQNYER